MTDPYKLPYETIVLKPTMPTSEDFFEKSFWRDLVKKLAGGDEGKAKQLLTSFLAEAPPNMQRTVLYCYEGKPYLLLFKDANRTGHFILFENQEGIPKVMERFTLSPNEILNPAKVAGEFFSRMDQSVMDPHQAGILAAAMSNYSNTLEKTTPMQRLHDPMAGDENIHRFRCIMGWLSDALFDHDEPKIASYRTQYLETVSLQDTKPLPSRTELAVSHAQRVLAEKDNAAKTGDVITFRRP